MKVGYQILADLQQQQAFKQWGINTGGAVRTSTLPIPFTNVFLAVASTSSEWCCPGCSATNTTVTTRAYQSNRPDVAQPNDVNWIIIGCQPQWGKPTVRGNNIFPIPFPNSALAITSAGIGGWHTVDVSIVNNNSYSVLGWATDSPSTARTSLPNVIAIGF